MKTLFTRLRIWLLHAKDIFLCLLTKDRHIDPFELFYLKDYNLVVPIVSKNACSAIKRALVSKYDPNFDLGFPDVHTVDPSDYSQSKVIRLFFNKRSEYLSFCKNKNVAIVLRDPTKRAISAYTDHCISKNPLFSINSYMKHFFAPSTSVSFEGYLKFITRVPLRFADRHYRPQYLYIPNKCTKLSLLRLENINEGWSNHEVFSHFPELTRENKNTTKSVELDENSIAILRHFYKKDYELIQK